MSSKRTYTVECIALDDFGRGLCHVDGLTVFVDNLLPGEKAIIETIFSNGRLKSTKLIKLLTKSESRIKPLCKFYNRCGSCNLQHLTYSKQLEYKREKVKNLLHKFAKIDIKVEDTIGLDNPREFRNKVQIPCVNKNNKIIAGYYKQNSHELIEIDNCFIESKIANEIVKKTISVLNDFKIPAYDTDKHTGIIRHILVKVSEIYKQALVVLVTAKEEIYGLKNIVKRIKDSDSRIVSITQNINTTKTNVILGQKTKILFGTGKICDRLCGLDFLISTRSFYQTNLKMTEQLYNTALKLAEINKNDIVLDAYCGTGSIGLIASKSAKSVIGVEAETSAIKDAIANAKINKINNIEFINQDCTEYINKIAKKNQFDIVILDPPRAGTTKDFIDSVQKIKPKKIIYISCDPVTLARDLKLFDSYTINKVQPIDMFPFTFHIETICSLSLKKSY